MNSKIVVIGSGSQFTEFLLQELFKFEEFKGCSLALVDRKSERLKHEVRLAKSLNNSIDWNMTIEGFTDRREALPGADIIYAFVAVNQKETWGKEFELARKYDINLLEAYTGGPAKVGMSIRHVPVMIDICRDIETLCPEAWLIMDNNPLPSLVAAVTKFTSVKNVGYCNGHELVEVALEQILEMTDRGPEQRSADPVEREFMTSSGNISITLAGINHLSWLLDIRNSVTGEDLYPELRTRLEDPELIPAGYHYSAYICKLFGIFPSCADGHISEHLWFTDKDINKRYNMEPYPIDLWFGNRDDRAWENLAKSVVNEDDARQFISKRRTGWYNAQIARIMQAGRTEYFPAVNVQNNGAISNLPEDIIVEVPGTISPDAINALQTGPLPEQVAPLCSLNGCITNLVAEAAVMGSKEKALQALILDPLVHSMTKAEKLFDDIMEYNKQYETMFS